MTENKSEEKKMADNGNGFSFGDALLTQAMTGYNGGRGGSNGSWFGGGCGPIASGPYADLGSVMHSIDNVTDCVRGNNTNLQREFSFNHQDDIAFAQNQQMAHNMLQVTGDIKDSVATSNKGFSDVLLEMCKCCGDAKLLTIQEGCKTREAVKDEGTKTRELFLTTELRKAVDENNINKTVGGINAQANANTQAIIQAIGGLQHHPHH